MMKHLKWAVLVWWASTLHAFAGMTVITLTDMARVRLDALSFFVMLYLLIAWLVKLAWNHLAAAFATMRASTTGGRWGWYS